MSTKPWIPRLAGLVSALVGLVNLASALTPEFRDRTHLLRRLLPLTIAHTASALTAVTGVLLVLLAPSLRRRKFRAWLAVCGLLALSVITNLAKGLDVEEAVVSAAALIILIVARGSFTAIGDPRGRLRAIGLFAGLLVIDVAVGFGLLAGREPDIVGSPSVTDRFREILYGLVGLTGPVHYRGDHGADVAAFILAGLGIATLVLTAYVALRPIHPTPALSDTDDVAVRRLLDTYPDSLGYFALRRDKSVLASPSGKAAVSYRVVSGVMLASGDPLGDPEAWPGAIEEFAALAARHAWTPAVIACSERGAQAWVRHGGLDALELGDEAIVDTASFTLSGRAMRNVRQMVARVERAGYRTRVRRVGDLTEAELAEVRARASAWRVGSVERGYSMALGRVGDPECVLALAYGHADGDDDLVALLHFVPWGRDGLSLDLMRRDRHADAGLSELLIVAALQAAPDLGVRRVSLNFAAFRGALERGQRIGAGPVARAQGRFLRLASRWFQIESLYRFNAKFQPEWVPRYVCFPRAGDLPRVGLAALRAEAFIAWPRREPVADDDPVVPDAAAPAISSRAGAGGSGPAAAGHRTG